MRPASFVLLIAFAFYPVGITADFQQCTIADTYSKLFNYFHPLLLASLPFRGEESDGQKQSAFSVLSIAKQRRLFSRFTDEPISSSDIQNEKLWGQLMDWLANTTAK